MYTFYIENDAEILPAHYTWKVAENGFKMAFMMNKLAMINSCDIILEKWKYFFCQKSFWNSGAHYTHMHIILDKIRYIKSAPQFIVNWLQAQKGIIDQ